MADGTLLKGAQGSFPFSGALAQSETIPWPVYQGLFSVPWLHPDPMDRQERTSDDDVRALLAAISPGVLSRHRSSLFEPVPVPDLIGVKDRHYLDRTGLQQHRSEVDLMRYAALNQGGDSLSSFAGFASRRHPNFKTVPEPTDPVAVGGRYSDEQLYALSLYIYSLKPPPNPNKFNGEAVRGRKVFSQEGCGRCHTPPLYTNNKLTPAPGFTVPEDHRAKYDVLPVSVGTDPDLTLKTRRGTGYYKVPSLKGVWYRSMSTRGWCTTLKDGLTRIAWTTIMCLPDSSPTALRPIRLKDIPSASNYLPRKKPISSLFSRRFRISILFAMEFSNDKNAPVLRILSALVSADVNHAAVKSPSRTPASQRNAQIHVAR